MSDIRDVYVDSKFLPFINSRADENLKKKNIYIIFGTIDISWVLADARIGDIYNELATRKACRYYRQRTEGIKQSNACSNYVGVTL
jgi:hypothetical protein